MFDILEADIVVMQELKIQRKDLRDDMVLVPGWDVYYSLPKHKKGYSGVAIYTRNSVCAPIRAEEGITGVLTPPNSTTSFRDLPPDQQIGGYPKPGQLSDLVDDPTLDSEGRCVILEFPAFVLIGTYSPANSDGTRDDFRLAFLNALDVRVRNLVAIGKRVVLTGDLNVIRDIADAANLAERLRKEGMTVEDFFSGSSRRLFNQLLFEGNVQGPREEGKEEPVLWDLGRLFHPTRQGMFTCWDTKKNCRPGNFGSRIDYVLCSDNMKHWAVDSNIQEGLMGSDHCPVYATFKEIIKVDGKEVHIKDMMNPEGVFRDGKRLRDWTTKDLLPTSAKLIPEFDRRRNIKVMFFKKPTTAPKPSTPLTAEPAPTPTGDGSLPSATPEQTQTPSEPPLSQPGPSSSAPSPRKPSGTGLKRTPSLASSASRPQKKTKATLSKEPSSNKGQSSLMGFFKPKATDSPSKNVGSADQEIPSTAGLEDSTAEAETQGLVAQKVVEDGGGTVAPTASGSGSDRVFDPIESKESWSKLMSKRVPPKCEHGDECISLTTKKAGANRGKDPPFFSSSPLFAMFHDGQKSSSLRSRIRPVGLKQFIYFVPPFPPSRIPHPRTN